jgi:hypothetical protein
MTRLRPDLCITRRDPGLARRILRASDPATGRIAITAVPRTRSVNPLTLAILEALGARHDVIGGHDHRRGVGWPLVPIRMMVAGVTELCVLEAQLLPADVLAELIETCASVGVHLTLVAHPPLRRPIDEFRNDWAPNEITVDQLEAAWARPKLRSLPAPVIAPVEFPTVPHVAFHLFRASCRDSMVPSDFAVVDELLRRVHAEASAWGSDARQRYSNSLIGDTICRHLVFKALREDGVTVDAAIVVVHAIAIALLRHDVLVRTNVDKLVAQLPRQPWWLAFRQPNLDDMWAYRLPFRGAVAACVIAGCTARQVAQLTVGDTAADGSSVAVDGLVFEVPAPAQPHLLAHLLYRGAEGADVVAPLFVVAHTGAPAKAAWVRTQLTTAATEVGILLDGRRIKVRPTESETIALRRVGVEVSPL